MGHGSSGNFFDYFIDCLRNTQPELSEEYVSSGYSAAVIFGLVLAGFVVFSTIAMKTKLSKGIVTAIFQVIGSVGSHLCVVGYSKMVMFAEIRAPQNQIDQAVADFYAEQIPLMLMYLIGFALTLVGVILMLVYVIPFLKVNPKVCGVFALVISILRIAFIQPINTFHVIEKATEADQVAWNGFYRFMALVPAILVGVVGLVTMLKRIKAEKNAVADVAAASEEPKAE